MQVCVARRQTSELLASDLILLADKGWGQVAITRMNNATVVVGTHGTMLALNAYQLTLNAGLRRRQLAWLISRLLMIKEMLIANHHHGLSLPQAYYICGALTPSQRPSSKHSIQLIKLEQSIIQEINILRISTCFS